MSAGQLIVLFGRYWEVHTLLKDVTWSKRVI